MGKGEWGKGNGVCGVRAPSFPKESNEESNDALGQRELGLAATVAQKIQVPGDFELAVKLRRGAKGNAETTNELKRCAEGVSFNHIGGYRYRCSTDLVGEAEVTTEGLLEGEPVGRTRHRIRAGRRQKAHLRDPFPLSPFPFPRCLNPRSSRGAVSGGVASPSPPACARPASKTSSVRSTCSGPAKPWGSGSSTKAAARFSSATRFTGSTGRSRMRSCPGSRMGSSR